VIFVLLAVLCFGFNVLHYYIGSEQSDAERLLHARHAAWWATAAEALSNIDYVVFTAIALADQSVVRASLVSFIPALIGAHLGEYRSVRKNWVTERTKAAEKAKRKAAGKPEILASSAPEG